MHHTATEPFIRSVIFQNMKTGCLGAVKSGRLAHVIICGYSVTLFSQSCFAVVSLFSNIRQQKSQETTRNGMGTNWMGLPAHPCEEVGKIRQHSLNFLRMNDVMILFIKQPRKIGLTCDNTWKIEF